MHIFPQYSSDPVSIFFHHQFSSLPWLQNSNSLHHFGSVGPQMMRSLWSQVSDLFGHLLDQRCPGAGRASVSIVNWYQDIWILPTMRQWRIIEIRVKWWYIYIYKWCKMQLSIIENWHIFSSPNPESPKPAAFLLVSHSESPKSRSGDGGFGWIWGPQFNSQICLNCGNGQPPFNGNIIIHHPQIRLNRVFSITRVSPIFGPCAATIDTDGHRASLGPPSPLSQARFGSPFLQPSASPPVAAKGSQGDL